MRAPLFALIASLAASPSFACQCNQPIGPLDSQVQVSADTATAIFSAEVLDTQDFSQEGQQVQTAQLRVIQTWKGPHPGGTIMETRTVTECCVCGLAIGKGRRMLVYVYGKPPYRLNDCSRTRELEGTDAELAVLDRLFKAR
jgi:hypothetical protein